MMRYLPLVAFVLVLVLPFVVQRFVRPAPPVARAEGTIRLTIMTSHNQDIRNEFARAFDRWHRERFGKAAELVYIAPGGGGEVRRYLEAMYAGQLRDGNVPESFKSDIDLVWGGGDFFFDVEIKRFLQPVDLPPALLEEVFPEKTLAGVRLYDFSTDKDGRPGPIRWVGICISSFGIVYNPNVYRSLGLPPPTTWSDLADERLFGWVAMANPASSSSAAVSYSMVLQRAMADVEEPLLKQRPELAALSGPERMRDAGYKAAVAEGWRRGNGTLLRIAANARYFTDSGTQPPNDVANGEAAVGMAIDFYGRVYEETAGRDRLRFFEPPAATAMNPDPIAILLGVRGEQYRLANRFIEFLLSKEGQRIWIQRPGSPGGPTQRALRRPPIRRDLYPPAGDVSDWTDPELNPFESAGGFNIRREWDALFTDTRMMWAAAWIDGREELRRAYRAVLAVRDERRRGELMARLSDFPMTYAELEAVQAERRGVPGPRLGEWRASKRVELARRFREHYRAVWQAAREAGAVATR
ncbi:MAG: ABC transporter substrate-binding protein [Tepidisphaerales bacterium]